MNPVIRSGAKALSDEEHKALSQHLLAIRWHIRQVLDTLNSRAYVKWLDHLLKAYHFKFLNGLRSALDDDYLHDRPLPSPYYPLDEERNLKGCPKP